MVRKMAGLAPGPRSGFWAQMATAIEALQPGWVVIENVRRLLLAVRRRPSKFSAQSWHCAARVD